MPWHWEAQISVVTEPGCPEHPGGSQHPSARPVCSLGAYWEVLETQGSIWSLLNSRFPPKSRELEWGSLPRMDKGKFWLGWSEDPAQCGAEGVTNSGLCGLLPAAPCASKGFYPLLYPKGNSGITPSVPQRCGMRMYQHTELCV